MKKIIEIENVVKFEFHDSVFVLLKNKELKKYNSEKSSYNLIKKNISRFMLFNDYLFCQEESDSSIIILELNGNEHCRYEGSYNLCQKNLNENEFLLLTKNVKEKQQLVLINKNLDQLDLSPNIYNHTIADKFVFPFKDSICCYDIFSGKVKWKVNIEDLGIEEFPLPGAEITVVEGAILFASDEKKLLCLSLESGKFNWLNESIAGGWSFTKNKLYGTYGKYIVEVDVDTGTELRKYNFENSDVLPNFMAMYKVWATPDWLLCLDSENEGIDGQGVVRILKRENFETTEVYGSNKFVRGYDENIHIDNKTLCLLDSESTLTVFSLHNQEVDIIS